MRTGALQKATVPAAQRKRPLEYRVQGFWTPFRVQKSSKQTCGLLSRWWDACVLGLSLDRRETQTGVSVSIINQLRKALTQNNL